MGEIVSLRQYIEHRDEISTIKVPTFCRLMKKVEDAMSKHDGVLVDINLNDIKINVETGDILFANIFLSEEDSEKTMASFDTGISLMASRKSSMEHKKAAFALMFLGWYCNDDQNAVLSDMEVLENFDEYIEEVPEWLRDFFLQLFKNLNYEESFSSYYNKNFVEVIKNKINDEFSVFNLNSEQKSKVTKLVVNKAKELAKESADSNGK